MRVEELADVVDRLQMRKLPLFIQVLYRATQHLLSKYYDGADITILRYEDSIVIKTKRSRIDLKREGERTVIVFRKYDEEGRLTFVKRAEAPTTIYNDAREVLVKVLESERLPTGYDLWTIYREIESEMEGEGDEELP